MLSRAVECCPTSVEVKVFLIAQGVNQRTKESILRSQRELKVTMSNRLKARENAVCQAALGFKFASDWLRGWGAYFLPIAEAM